MSHPIVPQKTYLLVFLGLIGLTLLTTGVAFINLGRFNTLAALLIATCKMLLVILFFMGVRHSSGLIRLTVVAAFFWFAILVSLTMSDYLTRAWITPPQSWSSSAPPTHP